MLEIVWEPIWKNEDENDSERQWYTLSWSVLQMFCEFALIWIQTRWTLWKLGPFMAMSLARTLSSIEMKDLVIKASQHQDDLAEMEEAQGKRRHKNTMSNTVVSKSKDS